MPIDPSFAVSGAEWGVGPVAPAAAPAPGGGEGSFGAALTDQLGALERSQTEAADAARALATGQAASPEDAVMAVERARLAMQLASTLRTKSVESIQDLLHTQV